MPRSIVTFMRCRPPPARGRQADGMRHWKCAAPRLLLPSPHPSLPYNMRARAQTQVPILSLSFRPPSQYVTPLCPPSLHVTPLCRLSTHRTGTQLPLLLPLTLPPPCSLCFCPVPHLARRCRGRRRRRRCKRAATQARRPAAGSPCPP
eukprot:365223-Chlamydomonas_euryale.AAC.3